MEYLLNIQDRLFKKNQRVKDEHLEVKNRTQENERVLKGLSQTLISTKEEGEILKKKIDDYKLLRKKMYSYQCPYCEKAFTTVDFLEKHVIRRHLQEVRDEAETERREELEKKLKQEAEDKQQELETIELKKKLLREQDEKLRKLKEEDEQKIKEIQKKLQEKEKLLNDKDKLLNDEKRRNTALLEENQRLERNSKLQVRNVDKLKKSKEELEKQKHQLELEKSKLENEKPKEKIVYVKVPENKVDKPERGELEESVQPKPYDDKKKPSTMMKDQSKSISQKKPKEITQKSKPNNENKGGKTKVDSNPVNQLMATAVQKAGEKATSKVKPDQPAVTTVTQQAVTTGDNQPQETKQFQAANIPIENGTVKKAKSENVKKQQPVVHGITPINSQIKGLSIQPTMRAAEEPPVIIKGDEFGDEPYAIDTELVK